MGASRRHFTFSYRLKRRGRSVKGSNRGLLLIKKLALPSKRLCLLFNGIRVDLPQEKFARLCS